MATTGAIIAGTGTSVTRGAGTAWTNPGNITANDGTVASCNSGASGSANLRASNFAFNIPANSLIQGFTVVVDMAESSAGTETVSVQLVGPAGTAIGTAKTFVASGTTLTLYTTGSSTDLWGTTGLTAADVNDIDFGVYVWYTTSHNTTVDYISIDVNYEPPNTGSLAATETGSDTAAINGDVIVQGSLSVTEVGSDTAAINGFVAAAGVTGSLAATEVGTDTASIAGDVLVQGSLAATETGSDSAVINGKVLVQGALNASETGSDTANISGLVLITGSLSATESGADTANINGQVLVQGSLDATEVGQDTAAFSGQQVPPITGTLAATESGVDVAAILGKIFVNGSLNATEVGQDVAQFSSQQPAPEQKGGGSFISFSSRSALVKAAERFVGLMTVPAIKQTKKVKTIVKKLESVTEDTSEEVFAEIADRAIAELKAQEKLSEFMVEIRQIRQTITDLKALKEQVEDEEETLLLLM